MTLRSYDAALLTSDPLHAQPIPQPARLVFAAVRLLTKLGAMPLPGPTKVPHAARLKHVHPRLFTGKPDMSVHTVDDVVEGRGGPIPVRVYARPDLRPGAPAILFIHGGGFIDYGLEFTDNIQRGLARRTGYAVVGLSYRLAPEHKFPAALEDCQDVLQWMVDTNPLGLDPKRLAVAGESAGGNLAAALCIANRDGAQHALLHQTIVYPFTDTTLTSTDWDTTTFAGSKRSVGEMLVREYAGAEKDNPLVNVLHAQLDGVPPAMVISVEHDPLKTDGIRFAQALAAAGVDTRHRHHNNMPHGYLVISGLLRQAERSLDEIAIEIAKRLGPAQVV